MKFLLDVYVSSRSLSALLSRQGHDVLSALTIDPRASDETLLNAARDDDRVLVTADKDLGDLFVDYRTVPSSGLSTSRLLTRQLRFQTCSNSTRQTWRDR